MTARGHPRTRFRRAIERGNLLLAELRAREMGDVSLSEALDLTALTALEDPARSRRTAGRWLQRYLHESQAPTLDDAALAVALRGELGGPPHAEAVASLRGLTTRRRS
jgi:hypothetical protein